MFDKTSIGRGLLSFCLVFLFACSTGSKKPPAAEPEPLKRTIVTASDLNPDSEGNPSPAVLMIFELGAVGAFQNADFFPLYEQPSRALGPDLITRPEEVKLRPDQTRETETEIDSQTRHIGVVVAFRDMEKAQWRAVVDVPEKKKKWFFFKSKKPIELGINVNSSKVTVTIQRP